MSSMTPPSFVDDGGSFAKRIPRGLGEGQVAKWVSRSGSETSRYTGSFVDDGADMDFRSGATPGFGSIDTRFYTQKKRRNEFKEGETVWNNHVQKAIRGDMHRNLEKMRGLRTLKVKGAVTEDGSDEGVGKGKGVEKDTVTVPMPLQWGTFVIKSDDGRVIVVEKDGEFDSGPQIDDEQERQRQHTWSKAASSLAPPSPPCVSAPPHLPKQHNPSKRQKEKEKQKNRDKKKRGYKSSRPSHHSPPKAFARILESEYQGGYLSSGGEDARSPTSFMMTGGASGWPSRTATCTASLAVSVSDAHEDLVTESAAKKIRDGYRHVRLVSHDYDYYASRVRLSPEGWGSPESSLVKSPARTASDASWDGGRLEDAWKVDSPARTNKRAASRRHGKSRKSHRLENVGNVSAKRYSTYQASTVEDAPSTSSALPHPHTWAYRSSQPTSEQDWGSRPKAADKPAWTGIEPFFPQQYATSPTRPSSEATWDGYEKVKTFSDVSIAGSDSERCALRSNSQISHYPFTQGRHESQASHSGGSRSTGSSSNRSKSRSRAAAG